VSRSFLLGGSRLSALEGVDLVVRPRELVAVLVRKWLV
jgi:hypothetical protein